MHLFVSPLRTNAVKGIALVLLSAAALGAVQPCARLALEAGANTLTIVTVRAAISAMIIACVAAGAQKAFHMSRKAWALCLLVGAAYAVMSFGLIGSVARIPVSLAILLYFTHPILVAGAIHLLGGDRLTLRRLGLAVLVLAGIALTLGQTNGPVAIGGILLALLASLATSVMILLGAKALRDGVGSAPMNVLMTVPIAIMTAVATTVAGAWALPSTMLGWAGLLGAGLGSAIGMLAFFVAFARIGAVRATMLSNVEPLLGVLAATIVLGEALGALQWGGVGLVVAALMLFEIPERSRVIRGPHSRAREAGSRT